MLVFRPSLIICAVIPELQFVQNPKWKLKLVAKVSQRQSLEK